MKVNEPIYLDCKTYPRMIRSLKAMGVDIRAFKKNCKKTLRQLFEETRRREVDLMWDPIRGRTVRCAHAVRVLITACNGRYILKETKREYPPTRWYLCCLNAAANLLFGTFGIGRLDPFYRTVVLDNTWTFSESCIKNESEEAAAVSGAWEECWIVLYEHLQRMVSLDKPFFEEHESSTYPGIWSYVIFAMFRADLPELPQETIGVVVDHGVKIHHQWFLAEEVSGTFEDTTTNPQLFEILGKFMGSGVQNYKAAAR